MNKRFQLSHIIPFVTVCIWGSLYIASGIVLKEMHALVLLFLRFFISSILLFIIGRKQFQRIRKEDIKEFLFIGFFGYFISNAALLLGIQYSNGSFSSLINAMSPVLITVFAVFVLKEETSKRQILAIIVSIIGAMVVIGAPSKAPTPFGIICCLLSVVLWSYVTIHIRKLTSRYPALQVTAVCMGIAAFFSFPCSLAAAKLTGVSIIPGKDLLLPIAYICVICTALSHYLWNTSLNTLGASYCASFYPFQPIVSVILGILLLNEEITMPFVLGMILIIVSMLIKQGSISVSVPYMIKKIRRQVYIS